MDWISVGTTSMKQEVSTIVQLRSWVTRGKIYVTDKDWYEYTSCYGGMLRLEMAVTISDDDIAVPLKEPAIYSLEGSSNLYPTAASYFVDSYLEDDDDELCGVISN